MKFTDEQLIEIGKVSSIFGKNDWDSLKIERKKSGECFIRDGNSFLSVEYYGGYVILAAGIGNDMFDTRGPLYINATAIVELINQYK